MEERGFLKEGWRAVSLVTCGHLNLKFPFEHQSVDQFIKFHAVNATVNEILIKITHNQNSAPQSLLVTFQALSSHIKLLYGTIQVTTNFHHSRMFYWREQITTLWGPTVHRDREGLKVAEVSQLSD